MACSSCARRRAQAQQKNQTVVKQATFSAQALIGQMVTLVYMGDEGRQSSVRKGVNYPVRKPGMAYSVLPEDVLAAPDNWQTDDFSESTAISKANQHKLNASGFFTWESLKNTNIDDLVSLGFNKDKAGEILADAAIS